MDRFLIRKDVYEDLIEKGYGKRDLSKLTKKQITDKNGHKRTVYVRNGEQSVTQKQPKTQELSEEKRAKYEEMLEKVKRGPEENALFVRGKGMLSKKDAIAHLSAKLGTKTVNSAAQGHLESDTPQNTDITKEDEERFGKQALSGLSGKRTGSEETEKKSSQKETFKSKTEKYKKMGLDDRASAAIVAIAEIEDEIRKTPDSDVKKLDELAALRTDVQLNGLKSKYVKQRMEEDFNNSDEGKEKTKRIDDFKSKMSKFKKWGLDDRAAAASVAIDEIEDQIRNTPDEEKDKLEELAALRTDVQLNGLNSKYIKEILG